MTRSFRGGREEQGHDGFTAWRIREIANPVVRTEMDNKEEFTMKVRFCGWLVVGAFVIAASAAHAADGQAVYNQNCGTCHNAISPKMGDKAAWAPRIKLGTDVLVANVIKGKGMMPPRAGKPALPDNDIKAAVGYIESKSQ